jgi:flagellar hook protein FlgE
VYDSLGVGHDVAVCFERSSDGAWSWRALADASEVLDVTGNPYSANAGEAFELASGTVSFDTDGNPVASSQISTSDWNFRGAASQAISFDFGVDALGVATAGSLRTSGNTSSVTSLVQDGRGAGELASVRVGPDGLVMGSYTNGEQQVLGQVAVATFEAEGGLVRMGGTLFASSISSGEPAVGVAGTGGRGSLAGNALERSNVELEEQFVNMITHQRSFQANAKVVSMADEALQVLVNLV